jgi:hypothetical protein
VRRRSLRVALTLAALAAVCCYGVERRDYVCELAYGHLLDCCPILENKHISCTTDVGCVIESLPLLRTDESTCILSLECSEIEQRGLCKAILALPPAVGRDCPDLGGTCKSVDTTATRTPICR